MEAVIDRLCRRLVVILLQGVLVIGCSASETGRSGMAMAEDSSGNGPTLRARLEAAADSVIKTRILFDLVNEGPGSARFLIWGSPLEWPLTADVFLVIGPDGREREYLGRMVKRAQPQADDMMTLAEGERRVVTIDLADVYEFDTSGSYEVRYRESAVRGFVARNPGLQFVVENSLRITLD